MKNFIFLIIISLTTVIHAQNTKITQKLNFRYTAIIHIGDTLVVDSTGTLELQHKYWLELPRYSPFRTFNIEDKVGFRIGLKYESSMPLTDTIHFILGYHQEVDHGSPLIDTDTDPDPILGGLRPITIPPIEDEDEDDLPVSPNNETFIFEQTGVKPLKINLYHDLSNGTGGPVGPHILKVDEIRGQFIVANYSSNHTQEPEIEVYPNPIQSVLHIKSPLIQKTERAEVTIYSTTGVQLYKNNTSLSTKSGDTTLFEFQNPPLSPGLYYYKIKIGNQTYTKSLLKK